MKGNIFISIFFLLISYSSYAQIEGQEYDFSEIRDQLEDALSNLEEESIYEDNSIFDILEDYFNNPIDINKASAEELKELRFLSDLQIAEIINHRKNNGAFIALFELQSIRSMDDNTIQLLLPFIKIKSGIDDYNVPLSKMLYKGKDEFFLRFERVLETKEGYVEDIPIEENRLDANGNVVRDDQDNIIVDTVGYKSPYLGDRNRMLFRYRHQYETTLSYGLLMEKDAGEQLFTKGFPSVDFLSFHFFLKDYNKFIKGLALGDFAVNMGQGLIQFDGFGSGKGAYVMDIKRLGRPLRPYTSASEIFYKRGAAINLNFGDNFEVMAFGSYRQRDANISEAIFEDDGFGDDLEIANVLEVSSLQTSGFHRTEAELLDKNAINHLSVGGTIKYKKKNWHIAANGLIDKLSSNLQRNVSPYNQFNFNGSTLKNASLDYGLVVSNFNFFGETAMSDNGGLATLNGLIIGLDRHVSMSILHRHYQREYQALFSNSFAETSNTNNETGIYVGLEVKPNKHWIISGYFDAWKHPWLRFGVDAPSNGKEYLTRITYKRKRKMQVYVQFKDELKERNARDNETNIDYLVDTRKRTLRLHIENNISKQLTLRNRAELTIYDDGVTPNTYGRMLLQDIIYKPIGFPLSFTSRFAIFNIEDSNNRIYSYENDILNSFSIPGYSNRGTRFYINLRYKGVRNMTMELRYAQTYYSNQDFFGSGQELINQPKRSEIKAQIKYKF